MERMRVVILVQRYFLGYNIAAEKKYLRTARLLEASASPNSEHVFSLCFASIMRCPP